MFDHFLSKLNYLILVCDIKSKRNVCPTVSNYATRVPPDGQPRKGWIGKEEAERHRLILHDYQQTEAYIDSLDYS